MNIIRRLVFCCGLVVCLLGLSVAETSAQYTKNPTPRIAKNTVEPNPSTTELENSSKSEEAVAKPLPSRNSNAVSRVGVQTGQTMTLSLDDAIRKALENNNDIEVAKNDVKIAESTLRSLLGIYDPVFTVSPTYTNNVQPQPSTLGGADLSGVTRSSEFRANGNYNQPVRRGGGNFSVNFNNSRNSTSSTFSQLNPTFNTNLGFSFTQPILRNRSIDNTRRQIRIQRKRVAQSDADFRRQTILIISQVQQGYWDLVFALRDQQNRMANLNLAKENLRQVEAKIEAGAAAPLARAEVETELANRESDLLLATQQVSQAENRLKQLVLREPDAPEWTTQFVPTDKPVFSDEAVNLDDVMKDAVENRPELRRLKLQNEINTIDIEYFKNQLRPQVDLTSSYNFLGLSGTPLGPTDSFTQPLIAGNPSTNANAFLLQQLRILNPNIVVPNVTFASSIPPQFIGGYGQSLQNLFSNNTRTFSVGVTISLPLRNQTAKADLATAQFQKTQIQAQTRAQEQTVVTEVRNAVQAVETTRQRVLTARRARENAEIQLAGERKLVEVGRSTTFLLFQRENALTNARNAEIRAETDYNKAVSDLQRATSTTFLMNNIEYVSPTNEK